MCHLRIRVLPYAGIQARGRKIPVALFWTTDGRDAYLGTRSDGGPDAPDRTDQSLRAVAFPDGAALGQYFRGRLDHTGVFLDDPDRRSDTVQRTAYSGRGAASVCVHAADDYLCVGGGGGRALGRVLGPRRTKSSLSDGKT